MWLRVFSPTRAEVSPPAFVAHLHTIGIAAVPHFKGDDHGWTTGELHLPSGGTPILMARYLTVEDDLRNDLNAYAAELETMTHSPHATRLMEQVIQTQQLMTIRKPIDHADESQLDRACEALVVYLARQSDGFYQIDRRGWFSSTSELLVEEF